MVLCANTLYQFSANFTCPAGQISIAVFSDFSTATLISHSGFYNFNNGFGQIEWLYTPTTDETVGVVFGCDYYPPNNGLPLDCTCSELSTLVQVAS